MATREIVYWSMVTIWVSADIILSKRYDWLLGSDFPVGVARHGQCQQSVTGHGIRLAEHFDQLLVARNTNAPGNAEAVIQLTLVS
jgi:hypothetical protein